MFIFYFTFSRIRYIKTITINTHIDCANNSKCSVGDILLATNQGAFESVFGTFSVKSQFKYEMGRLMGEHAVPLPLGNFSLNNKETRRLELWKNHRGMWFDHVEHMEEGQEQNKEWESFWWTVDEDMFTYVMKSKIEELID